MDSIYEVCGRSFSASSSASPSSIVPAVGQAATKKASRAQQRAAGAHAAQPDPRSSTTSATSRPTRSCATPPAPTRPTCSAAATSSTTAPTETWDARIARYIKAPLIGENIAWGTGSYGTPEGIVSQWMHSPTHRAIILTAGLHRVGLGLATGTFDGTPGAVMATADFAA